MKVKELIEELEKFDRELEVQYDFEEYATFPVDEVKEGHEDYDVEEKKVVILY